MSAAIRLDDLTLGYDGHPAVHHLSGTFAAGSLTAIVGPNGSGKSTLLKGIMGGLTPYKAFNTTGFGIAGTPMPGFAKTMRPTKLPASVGSRLSGSSARPTRTVGPPWASAAEAASAVPATISVLINLRRSVIDASWCDRSLFRRVADGKANSRRGISFRPQFAAIRMPCRRIRPSGCGVKPVIRLVKGAYAEPAQVAFPRKADTDRAYYEISDAMLKAAAAGNCLPIFGTHDVGLVGRIIARAKELGVAPGKYEVHMLYGIKDGEQQRLRSSGESVTTLISYGASWFKWYMRRLAERPANVGFVIRSMLG